MRGWRKASRAATISVLLACVAIAVVGSPAPVHCFEPVQQQKVTLTKPNGGERLASGQTAEVAWSYSGPRADSQRWRLVLVRGGETVGVVAEEIAGTSYRWQVGRYRGGTAALGGDYKVVVVSDTGVGLRDTSDGVFSIVPGALQSGADAAGKGAVTEPIRALAEMPFIECSITASAAGGIAVNDGGRIDSSAHPPPLPLTWRVRIANGSGNRARLCTVTMQKYRYEMRRFPIEGPVGPPVSHGFDLDGHKEVEFTASHTLDAKGYGFRLDVRVRNCGNNVYESHSFVYPY